MEPLSGFESGSCVVDIDILIKFRNGYRKIMQSIRITSRPPVTSCVIFRNNFQMLKRNCWKAKKDFPLPIFTVYRLVSCAPFLMNLRKNFLPICLFLVPQVATKALKQYLLVTLQSSQYVIWKTRDNVI